ncbi:MsnO8 family LLM class oxidoreductase [Corynebacterium sp.]|uniref:MsnO8 family LLM class oxidoreductase n=1 Tax=Corynebacterium TaxID=1716 RepID=UPI0026499A02|nr:MsnO8 family LLM class oxidoreductase [Corynebacterium sp.]MDN5723329.1 MsnO8 family LLM class oxidoreductase [Corynebacterium sp.]MDN6397289.1 MsnO8 family LLM class oxidoreductase [Corynebacterium sp.]MDN6405655.1 MsnO8 family LLM class oxidoreductase [Corynebacterium sp.]
MRISLLDRANTLAGRTGAPRRAEHSDAASLRAVVDRARRAEDLGYHRFLVAEHNGVPGIAGSAPSVLTAAVGQATSTIRIGTAGIMLPDHVPFVVAEQVAVLAALFPGRVDIGFGSSVGFTPAVRKALRQDEDAAQAREGYLEALDEVLGYLRGAAEVTLRPDVSAAQEKPGVFLLSGGSPSTVQAAAERGLGLILGGPGTQDAGTDATTEAPIVSATVAVAASREAARDLVLPEVWAQVMSRSTGVFEPLSPVGELDEVRLTGQQRRRIQQGVQRAIYGTQEEVAAVLGGLESQGFPEILVTGGMSDVAGQRNSDELLSELVGAGAS